VDGFVATRKDALLSCLFEKFQERIRKPFIRMKGFRIRSFKYYEWGE